MTDLTGGTSAHRGSRHIRFLPLLLLVCAVAFTPSLAANPTEEYEVYYLTGPAASYLMASGCPQELTLFFSMNCQQPGVLFDTVGINSANQGDWIIRIDPQGRLSFSVYAPRTSSPFGDGSGWLRFFLEDRLAFNTDYYIHVEIEGGTLLILAVDDQGTENYIYEKLPVNLRSTSVYAGDYPGDDGWGERYNIHPAATALMIVFYFGPYVGDIYGPNTPATWIIPGSGIDIDGTGEPVDNSGLLATTEEDTADWGTAGDWFEGVPGIEDLPADSGTTSQPPAVTQSPPTVNFIPAAEPAAAVRAFLEAQVAEDIDRALAYTALDGASPAARQEARRVLEVIAAKTDSANLQFKDLATAYGRQGNYAIVRCLHSATVRTATETDSSTVGSLVITRRYEDGWKVAQFIVDDLMNAELEYRSAVAQRTTGLVLASNQTGQAVSGELKSEAELSELLSTKLNNYYFDESKTMMNELFSIAGWIPIVGDLISNAYTLQQTISTIIYDLIPAYRSGDLGMYQIAKAQVASGIIQMTVEVVPFLDTVADQVGTVLDNQKHRIKQVRSMSRLKFRLQTADLDGPKKYLYLHNEPIYADPETGFKTGGRDNIAFEYYDDRRFKPAPLKKIVFLSDTPLREWKTIGFDLGYYFTIKQSDSEALFAAATDAGFPVHAISGMIADYEVYIPMKLNTVTASGPLVVGEMPLSQLELNPQGTVALPIESRGTPILQEARLVTGSNHDRHLQFRITHRAGPNQTIQIELTRGQTRWTQPLEIENRVFNEIEGVLVKELSPGENFPVNNAKIPRGEELVFQVFGDTRAAKLRPPMIQDLIQLDCGSADDTIASAELGDFPDGLLWITGKRNGLTAVGFRFMWANQDGVNPIEDDIEVEVSGEGDWVLSDIEYIPDGTPGPEIIDQLKRRSVSGTYDLSQYYDQEAWIRGAVTWNEPPASFPDKGGTWQLEGSLSSSCRIPDDIGAEEWNYDSRCVFGLGIWGMPPEGVNPQEWEADLLNPQVNISTVINMDEWCEPEAQTLDPTGATTGRRLLMVHVSVVGKTGYVVYCYENKP